MRNAHERDDVCQKARVVPRSLRAARKWERTFRIAKRGQHPTALPGGPSVAPFSGPENGPETGGPKGEHRQSFITFWSSLLGAGTRARNQCKKHTPFPRFLASPVLHEHATPAFYSACGRVAIGSRMSQQHRHNPSTRHTEQWQSKQTTPHVNHALLKVMARIPLSYVSRSKSFPIHSFWSHPESSLSPTTCSAIEQLIVMVLFPVA